MTGFLWIALFAQMAMGGFDTLYHHEATERLAWRPTQRTELALHGIRNLAYAIVFLALGWTEPAGAWAMALLAILAAELGITLWDFVEEDRTRHLPASERVIHTLLTLNYGVILAGLVPWLIALAHRPTCLMPAHHPIIGPICALAALGVVASGLRDLAAARRAPRLTDRPAASLASALDHPCTILITGGTGFVGQRLVAALAAAGHEVIVLTRDGARARRLLCGHPVRLINTLDEIRDNARIDAIINLAGEPISSSPWTRAKRIAIVRSRLAATHGLVRLIARLHHKPAVLISGSAIGWYGLGDTALTEADGGTACFSRRICVSWEHAAERAARHGVRVVRLRIGLVLDRDGGILSRLLAPFEFGLGGRFGNGQHWMSWIHRDDLVRLICHAIARADLAGPVNAVAPEPATNRQFTAALARALHRAALLPVPAWPLRLALGGFADELLLGGQRVLPRAAMASGFAFEHATLASALNRIVGNPDQPACQSAGLCATMSPSHAAN